MMELTEFTTFLGWCTVINTLILAFSSAMIQVFKGTVTALMGRQSGMDEQKILTIYYTFLANYKICIIVFNLVPYIALKIMS